MLFPVYDEVMVKEKMSNGEITVQLFSPSYCAPLGAWESSIYLREKGGSVQ